MVSHQTASTMTIHTLIGLGLVMSGCTSLYHVAMSELDRCIHDALAMRLREVQENTIAVRDALNDTFAMLETIDGNTPKDSIETLQYLIHRAELETWNLRRRVASVDDMKGEQRQTIALNDATLALELRHAVLQFHRLDDELSDALLALNQKRILLAAGIDPYAVRSLQPTPLLNQSDRKELMDRIDAAAARTDSLVAQLESVEWLFTMQDRARDHAAAQ